jgi:hypothetical protein
MLKKGAKPKASSFLPSLRKREMMSSYSSFRVPAAAAAAAAAT